MESKKLSQEELTLLRSLVSELNGLQMECGKIEIHKHNVLHQIDNVSATLENNQAVLKSKYGDVMVDINTGDLKDRSNEAGS